ncbi:hypothetical protein myaer87_28250 [Microcystis aeruginosa NIES-87]|nr:hypothetical protein myaer87_28250 [Microcystis aeruginosa NIES-87]
MSYSVFQSAEVQKLWVLGKREEKYVYLTSLGNAIMTNDLKDRHVLATAVMAKANLILTNNLTNFSLSALET